MVSPRRRQGNRHRAIHTANEMGKRSLASWEFSITDASQRDLLALLVPEFCVIDVLLARVDLEVKEAKVELAQVEETFVDGIALDDLVDELVGNRLARLVVLGHLAQHLWDETPILVRLARAFDKVSGGAGAVEASVLRSVGSQAVVCVAHLWSP